MGTGSEYVEFLRSELATARDIVRTRITKVQRKQEETYNESHRAVHYEAGDLVMVFKPIRKVKRAEKLLHRWLGPYTAQPQYV